MKTVVCILFFLFSFAPIVLSQKLDDSLRRIYNDRLLYRFGGTFRVGTEKLNFNQIEDAFQISELGLDLYRQAKKFKTIGTVIRFVSLLSGLAGIAYINDNRNTAYAFLGGQIVLGFAGLYYSKTYNERLDQAIWQRNKDLLFPQR